MRGSFAERRRKPDWSAPSRPDALPLPARRAVRAVVPNGFAHGSSYRTVFRLIGCVLGLTALAGLGVWGYTGLRQPGRAVPAAIPTPSGLPAPTRSSSRPGTTASRPVRPTRPAPAGTSAASTLPAASTAGAAIPTLPFSAALAGKLAQTGPDRSGQVTITITAAVSGRLTGDLSLVLRGRAAGTGVYLSTSIVTFGPTSAPTAYEGEVAVLNGDQVVASVASAAGQSIDLGMDLQIDPVTGGVRGVLHAEPGSVSSAEGTDGDDHANR